MRISTKFTYEDLQAIPQDRNRYEIVEGELFVTPAPIPLHQRIAGNLYAELRQHIRKHSLGEVLMAPVDVVFSDSTVLEPDIVYVSRARQDIIGEKNLSGSPDLVVEVLSPSTQRLDRRVKPKQYALYGVPEFWRIDPDAEIVEVFRLANDAYEQAASLGFGDELTSPLFPGLSLPVATLWER
ncbi:MAG: Uma2 family endonuclease [Acidobacteria bacterium]|nr:Uma2 family endonuclease [Acidobacteriota bacterium]